MVLFDVSISMDSILRFFCCIGRGESRGSPPRNDDADEHMGLCERELSIPDVIHALEEIKFLFEKKTLQIDSIITDLRKNPIPETLNLYRQYIRELLGTVHHLACDELIKMEAVSLVGIPLDSRLGILLCASSMSVFTRDLLNREKVILCDGRVMPSRALYACLIMEEVELEFH